MIGRTGLAGVSSPRRVVMLAGLALIISTTSASTTTQVLLMNLVRIDLAKLAATRFESQRSALALRIQDRAGTVLTINPASVNAQQALAEVAIRRGRWDDAIRILQALADENRLDALGFNRLGGAYYALGQTGNAVAAWFTARNTHRAVLVLWDEGNGNLASKKTALARAEFLTLIQAASLSQQGWKDYWISEGYRGIAASYAQEHRWNDTLLAARTSLEFNSCNIGALGHLAAAREAQSDPMGAGLALEEAISCSPDNPYASSLLADWRGRYPAVPSNHAEGQLNKP